MHLKALLQTIFILILPCNFVVECAENVCKENPIELNIENADVIIAGTVRKLNKNYSDSIYGAYVQIHRVIKGHNQVYDIFNLKIENRNDPIERANRNLAKRTNKLTINGNILFINNFGSGFICESNVKPHDVRIFLLSIDKHKNLYLNSSLIQPILAKAKNLNTYIENEYYEDTKSKLKTN